VSACGRLATLETHTVLRAFADGQRQLIEKLRALIARVDVLIRGRRNGRPE
jgi:hypothetical protein